MKIAYMSTYLPQQCGIATYTEYLVHGITKVGPALEIKVVAEKGASLVKRGKFEVVPYWDRNRDYVKPITRHTSDGDIVHIQHEYSIYRLPLSGFLHMEARTGQDRTGYCVLRKEAGIAREPLVQANKASRKTRVTGERYSIIFIVLLP